MKRLLFVCLLLPFAAGLLAEDAETEVVGPSKNVEVRRHRIEIGAIHLDGQLRDSFDIPLGYTYSLAARGNLTLNVVYKDPDISLGSDSGFGDTVLAWSFVPKVELTANPWVPKTVGSGVALVAPTGNANAGRSLDTWVIAPYLGLVIPLSRSFFFAPQFGYVHSFDKTVADTDLRLAFAELGVGYVSDQGLWGSYFAQPVRDLETHEWAFNQRIAFGKMFSQSFGIGMDYVIVERFNFGSPSPRQPGTDERIELRMHYVF